MPLFRPLVFLVLSCLLGGAVGAQTPRIALVVGNAAYEASARLKNPVNDAADMAAALKRAGWTVELVTDADRRAFTRAVAGFRDALASHEGADALFYYAGHGMQVDGTNYLIPVRTPFDTVDDIKADAISLTYVTEAIQAARVSVSLVILDACRDNPFAKKLSRSVGGTRGLNVVNGGGGASGSAVLFSTSPGDVAQDGEGRNGVFTGALLNHIGSDLTLEDLFKKVTGEVRRLSGGSQNPWINASLSQDFYFLSDAIRADLAAAREAADREARQSDIAEAARQATQAASQETQRARADAETARKAAAEALAAKAAVEARVSAEANRPKGKVRIESYEPGSVFWGSELLGEVGPDSPLMADSLDLGRQEFRFAREGRPDVVKAANVGEKAYVTVTFGTAPMAAGTFPGSLSVSVAESGAMASLDDGDDVALPHVFEGVVPGDHELVIRDVVIGGRYYAGVRQTVTVVAGRQVKVRPTLELGKFRLGLTGFPTGSTASVTQNQIRTVLAMTAAADGTFGVSEDVLAGDVVVEVVAKNSTWTRSYRLLPGQELALTPQGMERLVTLERKSIRLTGKAEDFDGIEVLFNPSRSPNPGPFPGFRISGGTVCRDEGNLYVLIRYRDGKPAPVKTSFRYLELVQGELQYHLGAGMWDDGRFHTNSYNERTGTSTEGGSLSSGADFLEMRFPLTHLVKSFFAPKGFDPAKPIRARLATWHDLTGQGDGTEYVNLLLGP